MSVGLGEAALGGPGGDLGAGGTVELGEDAADVGGNRALTDEEGGRDLAVRLAAGDQGGDLALAPGEAAVGLAGGAEGGRGALRGQRGERGGAEALAVGVVGDGGGEGGDQLARRVELAPGLARALAPLVEAAEVAMDLPEERAQATRHRAAPRLLQRPGRLVESPEGGEGFAPELEQFRDRLRQRVAGHR